MLYSESVLLCVDQFLHVTQGPSLSVPVMAVAMSFSGSVAYGEAGKPSPALAKILTPLPGTPGSLHSQIPHSYGSISPEAFSCPLW